MDIEEMGYAAFQGDNATLSRFILLSQRPGRLGSVLLTRRNPPSVILIA